MINYIHVIDSYVEILSDGRRIPVSSFSCTYSLNKLPTANVVPALGRNLTTGDRWSLADVPVDEEVSLVMSTTEEDVEILRGYVHSRTGQTLSQFDTVNNANAVTIVHRASKLAGSPMSSFTYVSAMKSLILTRYNKFYSGLFGSGEGHSGASDAIQMATSLYPDSWRTAGTWPAQVIKDMVIRVLNNNYPADYDPSVGDYLVAYGPANFSRYYFAVQRIYDALHTAFVKTAPSSNLWSAMQNAAANMFLTLVPSASKMHIANPLSIRATADVTVTSSEYSGFSQSTGSLSRDPVDHVIVRTFDKGPQDRKTGEFVSNFYAYPPFRDQNGNVIEDLFSVERAPKGVFCHFRTAPSWITKETAQENRATRPTDEFVNARAVAGRKVVDDEARNAGTKLAQMYYAMTEGKRFMNPTIRLPFRTDVMPGTMLHLDGVESDMIGSNGLYGMVKTVKIECEHSDDPKLMLEVTLDDARTEEDNAPFADGGLAITDAALFEENWKGVNMDGSYLTDAPFTAPPTPGTPSSGDRSTALSGASSG